MFVVTENFTVIVVFNMLIYLIFFIDAHHVMNEKKLLINEFWIWVQIGSYIYLQDF